MVVSAFVSHFLALPSKRVMRATTCLLATIYSNSNTHPRSERFSFDSLYTFRNTHTGGCGPYPPQSCDEYRLDEFQTLLGFLTYHGTSFPCMPGPRIKASMKELEQTIMPTAGTGDDSISNKSSESFGRKLKQKFERDEKTEEVCNIEEVQTLVGILDSLPSLNKELYLNAVLDHLAVIPNARDMPKTLYFPFSKNKIGDDLFHTDMGGWRQDPLMKMSSVVGRRIMYKGFERLVNKMVQVNGKDALLLDGYYVVLEDELMSDYAGATVGSLDEDEEAEREWMEELHTVFRNLPGASASYTRVGVAVHENRWAFYTTFLSPRGPWYAVSGPSDLQAMRDSELGVFDYGVVHTEDWDKFIQSKQADKGDEYRNEYSLLPLHKFEWLLPQTLFSGYALRIEFDDDFMARFNAKDGEVPSESRSE